MGTVEAEWDPTFVRCHHLEGPANRVVGGVSEEAQGVGWVGMMGQLLLTFAWPH